MKMVIEVNGGVVCSILSTQEVSIYIVNHDSLKAGDGIEQVKEACQPDFIGTEEEVMKELDECLAEHGL